MTRIEARTIHAIRSLEVDPQGLIRLVLETSDGSGEPYNRQVFARGDDAVELADMLPRAVESIEHESGRDWLAREVTYADCAGEFTEEMAFELERILGGDLLGRDPDGFWVAQILGATDRDCARAAQFIECTRGTCGGPDHPGHVDVPAAKGGAATKGENR